MEIPPEIETLLARFIGVDNTRLLRAINSVAGHDLTKEQRDPWDGFHKFVTDPQPDFITKWRENPETEQRCYGRFMNGISHNAHFAYAAAYYHHSRLTEIEHNLQSLFADYDFEAIPPGMSMGMGNTKMWDYEYQAFVLAYRRCLDYFTYGINVYFKHESRSFNEWITVLENLAERKNNPVAKALRDAYVKHRPNFNFVITTDGKKSVRDKIAHELFVGTPAINITRKGIFYAGGGEDFGFGKNENKLLTEVLQERLDQLAAYLKDSIQAIITTAT